MLTEMRILRFIVSTEGQGCTVVPLQLSTKQYQ